MWAFYNKVLVKFWILLCTLVISLFWKNWHFLLLCWWIHTPPARQRRPSLDRVGKQSWPFSIVSCKIHVTLLKVQQSFCSPLSAHDLIQLCISGGFLSVRNISKLKNHPKKTPTYTNKLTSTGFSGVFLWVIKVRINSAASCRFCRTRSTAQQVAPVGCWIKMLRSTWRSPCDFRKLREIKTYEIIWKKYEIRRRLKICLMPLVWRHRSCWQNPSLSLFCKLQH